MVEQARRLAANERADQYAHGVGVPQDDSSRATGMARVGNAQKIMKSFVQWSQANERVETGYTDAHNQRFNIPKQK